MTDCTCEATCCCPKAPAAPVANPDELERLARAATPGPWVVMDGANSHIFDQRIVSVKDEYSGVGFSGEPDAAFIAAANPATILALLSANREMREALEEIADYSGGIMTAEEASDRARSALTTQRGEK